MAEQFWHNRITDKSFDFLQDLKRKFDFVLIGGWAVYVYTHSLKSKDIDIIVDFDELSRFRLFFDVTKNERLKKYEIQTGNFDVDIYVPHWSELGLPLDFVVKNSVVREGFMVPRVEILLALKLFVYSQRKPSLKGKKDLIDIISILRSGKTKLAELAVLLKEFGKTSLLFELEEILKTTFEIKELSMNQKKFSDFKKPILWELKKLVF